MVHSDFPAFHGSMSLRGIEGLEVSLRAWTLNSEYIRPAALLGCLADVVCVYPELLVRVLSGEFMG